MSAAADSAQRWAVQREPVFILAPPRSFTSLVSTMLGQHPQMYGFPELNLFMAETMDEFWRGFDRDGGRKSTFWPVMRHGLLRTVAQLYAGEQTIDSVALAYRWIRVRAQHRTGETFRELLAKIEPLIAVEKPRLSSPSALSGPVAGGGSRRGSFICCVIHAGRMPVGAQGARRQADADAAQRH